MSKFNEIVLIDIYPAREKPIKGVSSKELLNKIHNNKKKLVERVDLTDYIVKSETEVIVVMGAGDISKEVDNIKNAILN